MGAEPGEAFLSVVLPAALGEDDVLALHAGRRGAGGRVRRDDRGRRPGRGPGADDRGHGDRLGGRGRRSSWAATARGRATSSASPATSGRGGRPRRRSTAAREGPAERHLRPRPRLAEGRALAAAGRARDARPLRRARARRAPAGRGERRAAGARHGGAAGRARDGGGGRRAGDDARPSWPPPAARTTSCCFCVAPEARAAAESAGAVTWIGRATAGVPGVGWRGDPSAARWRGYEHCRRLPQQLRRSRRRPSAGRRRSSSRSMRSRSCSIVPSSDSSLRSNRRRAAGWYRTARAVMCTYVVTGRSGR